MLLRRIAFMSAALSQVSGLGVAVAFWAGSLVGISPHEETPWWLSPSRARSLFAAVGAVVMALPAQPARHFRERGGARRTWAPAPS